MGSHIQTVLALGGRRVAGFTKKMLIWKKQCLDFHKIFFKTGRHFWTSAKSLFSKFRDALCGKSPPLGAAHIPRLEI